MLLTRSEIRAALFLLLAAEDAAAACNRRPAPLPGGVLVGAGDAPAQLASLVRRGWVREADGGYVLTDEGARKLRPAAGRRGGGPKPFWDRARGELRLAGIVVKRLPATATAQVAVLEALQEAGWPAEIEVVAEGEKARQPKLREAVRNLNRSRLAPGLSFWLSRGRLGWSAVPES